MGKKYDGWLLCRVYVESKIQRLKIFFLASNCIGFQTSLILLLVLEFWLKTPFDVEFLDWKYNNYQAFNLNVINANVKSCKVNI